MVEFEEISEEDIEREKEKLKNLNKDRIKKALGKAKDLEEKYIPTDEELEEEDKKIIEEKEELDKITKED